MNNLENKLPTTGNVGSRPSLMAQTVAASIAPEVGNGQQPTRVLAELGGKQSSTRFVSPAAAMVLSAVVVATGAAYWVGSRVNASSSAAEPYVVAPPPAATARTERAATTASPSVELPDGGAAKIIAGDIAAAADLPTTVTSVAVAAPEKAQPRAAAETRPRERVKSAFIASTRDKTPHQKARPVASTATVAAARSRSKPIAAATKTRSGSSPRLARATTSPIVSKRARPDTDTELLAAMLRRSGGEQ